MYVLALKFILKNFILDPLSCMIFITNLKYEGLRSYTPSHGPMQTPMRCFCNNRRIQHQDRTYNAYVRIHMYVNIKFLILESNLNC